MDRADARVACAVVLREGLDLVSVEPETMAKRTDVERQASPTGGLEERVVVRTSHAMWKRAPNPY